MLKNILLICFPFKGTSYNLTKYTIPISTQMLKICSVGMRMFCYHIVSFEQNQTAKFIFPYDFLLFVAVRQEVSSIALIINKCKFKSHLYCNWISSLPIYWLIHLSRYENEGVINWYIISGEWIIFSYTFSDINSGVNELKTGLYNVMCFPMNGILRRF